jgi:hypothetical protein
MASIPLRSYDVVKPSIESAQTAICLRCSDMQLTVTHQGFGFSDSAFQSQQIGTLLEDPRLQSGLVG